jgi:hypothetical protein
VPVLRKLCGRCGTDVTREKRVKSETGEYYCHGCWEDSYRASGLVPAYACCRCGGAFAFDDVFQATEGLVCRRCRQGMSPADLGPDIDGLLEAAAEIGGEASPVFTPAPVHFRRGKASQRAMILWMVGAAVLFGLIIALVALLRPS